MKNLQNHHFFMVATQHTLKNLHAKYVDDPSQLDQTWQEYFKNLKEDKNLVLSEARGATWETTRLADFCKW